MIQSYDEYLLKKNILTFEDCVLIHSMIKSEVGSDPDAIELYDELLQKAIEYAIIRASWSRMSIEEKIAADEGRTLKHDSVIVKFNQLAKYLKMKGNSAKWRYMLGYECDDKMNRKKIGDMACFISYVHGINAR